jgi:hypothetical protein
MLKLLGKYGAGADAHQQEMALKTPKILPWIGRRAALSDQLTLKLWRRASGEAANRCGSWKSSTYCAEAMARVIDLVEDESVSGQSIYSMSLLNLMCANQELIFELSRLAMESSSHLRQLSWDVFVALRERRK